MGPTLIFDKSFLQSVKIDESVFLQQFFLTNITPLFYVETLGDLDLVVHKGGRPITDIISELAAKIPSTGIFPNIHHMRLLVGNLYGIPVEMDGRSIREGGVEKIDPDGNIGIHYGQSEEENALRRWNNKEYSEVERLFSKSWRIALSNYSFDRVLGIVKNIVPIGSDLATYESVLAFVVEFIKNTPKELLLYLICEFMSLPNKVYQKSLNTWTTSGISDINSYAPYAAFVLKVELFFYICQIKGLEAKDRPSHKIDLAYLFYLPFCNVFISSDKLHIRIAHLFLRDDQMFMGGDVAKKGLNTLDLYYSQYLDEIAEKGFMGFASTPPKDVDNSISDIWDNIFPNWRTTNSNGDKEIDPEEEAKMVEQLRRVQNESKEVRRSTPMDDVHHVISVHKVRVQKGKYRILPKGIENKVDDE